MASYQRFLDLCEKNHITPSAAMIQAGLSKSLATKWKQEKNFTPNADSIKKLCKLFDVTADYFISSGAKYDDYDLDPPEILDMVCAMRIMTKAQRDEIMHYAKYIAPFSFSYKEASD